MTSRALNSAYTHSGVMYGRGKKIDQAKGLVNNLQAANTYAKDHRVVTAGKQFTDSVGLTGFLDRKSNGLYSKGADRAIQAGYGKRRKAKPKSRKK